jgi:GT2 family glycosyltransferase
LNSIQHRIFVAVPVYQGWEHVEETLRSIQEQTYKNFRVLISVDGGDERSADVCRPFIADNRFQLVVQQKHLGWAGNINWLAEQCDGEYFCYYQQDDVTDRRYFEVLIAEADRNADAAVTFSDVQYFGDGDLVEPGLSILGDPFSRVLSYLEAFNHVPLYGLIRENVLRQAGQLRITENDSFGEDFPWMLKMARAGAMRRVPRVMYFKRQHPKSISREWFERWPQERRRAALIGLCAGLLEAALPVGRSERERFRLLFAVLELLASRQWFHETNRLTSAERRRLVIDFIAELWRCNRAFRADQFAVSREALLELSLRCFGLQDKLGSSRFAGLMKKHRALEVGVGLLKEKLSYRIGDEIDFSTWGESRRFMQGAWGEALEWGVWTHDRTAELTLWPQAHSSGQLVMRAYVMPFLAENQNTKRLVVSVNDIEIGLLYFALRTGQADKAGWIEVPLPADFASSTLTDPVRITFAIDGLPSRSCLELPNHAPLLGIGFHRLRIEGVAQDEA